MIQGYNSSAAVLYQSVRRLLAKSEAFQTFVDVTSEADALERVYFEGFPEIPANGKEYGKSEYNAWLPCAIVRLPYTDAGIRGTLDAFGSSFENSGSVDIVLEASVPMTEQRNNIPKPDFMYRFVTHIGQILDELIYWRGQPDQNGNSVFDFSDFAFLTFAYTTQEMVPDTGLNIQTLITLSYGKEPI